MVKRVARTCSVGPRPLGSAGRTEFEVEMMNSMRVAPNRDDRGRKGGALAPPEEAPLRGGLQPLKPLPGVFDNRKRLQRLKPLVAVAGCGGAEAPPFQTRGERSGCHPQSPQGMHSIAGGNAPGRRNSPSLLTLKGSHRDRGAWNELDSDYRPLQGRLVARCVSGGVAPGYYLAPLQGA